MNFITEAHRMYSQDEAGRLLAEITFPETEPGVYCIEHTFVDDSLRGQGIAGQLVEMAAAAIRKESGALHATCTYARHWLETHPQNLTADQALERLRRGNRAYLAADRHSGNYSAEIRHLTHDKGQKPYAIIVGCSDSRAVPEVIFNAALGDLFVIRVAGNVIDDHQLGSIEYAADHLGVNLVVVLGHDHCGAVGAALHHVPDGHIRHITDEILSAIGTETDELTACRLNVRHSVQMIHENADIHHLEEERHIRIIGALYHLDSGEVEFDV